MIRFKRIKIENLKENLTTLDSNKLEKERHPKLNKSQKKFLKDYLSFQNKLLKKIVKDNNLKEKYCIIAGKNKNNNSEARMIMIKEGFYYQDFSIKQMNYRLIKDKLFLEKEEAMSRIFFPEQVSQYRDFFNILLSFIGNIIDSPKGQNIEKYQEDTEKNMANKIKFNQIIK